MVFFDPVCLEIKTALEAIRKFQRRFFPLDIESLREGLNPLRNSICRSQRMVKDTPIQPDSIETKTILNRSIDLILEAFEMILNASTADFQQTIVQVMKAFRKTCRAQEYLYPIRHISPHLKQIFLEPAAYHRMDVLDPGARPEIKTGLIHEGVEENYYARSALSIYIPESYDGSEAWPMVTALHGGFGHGRDFIWTWLREAKSRRFLLLAPTSLDTTWSLMNPHRDGLLLQKMLDYVLNNWSVDHRRMLLTGISDGGTFAMISALQEASPFTAFAPIACTLPPMDISYAKSKRILWIHGALDWMFPLPTAQGAAEMLKRAGADITLRLVDDLSHTYPRDENDRILKWFDPKLALPENHLV